MYGFALLAMQAAGTVHKTIEIAPGVEMPVVALGTGEYQGDAAAAAVTSALEMGYRSIDTANEYQNQEAIGHGIRNAVANATLNLTRSDIFVISKVEGGLSAAETAAKLKEDTQLLNVGVIDLILLHFPKPAPPLSLEDTIKEQWRAIADFVQAGGARAAGVSQFCSDALSYLDDAKVSLRPVLNQVGWHVGQGKDPQGLASVCSKRKDMTLMAYSPLAEASDQILKSGACTQISQARGGAVTPSQVALRWLLQLNVPYAAAASNPVYQAENLNVFGFTLTPGEMSLLSNATEPVGSPFWPGSACWKLCPGCDHNHTCCSVAKEMCPLQLPPCA
jgi:diketogulonate reductase-like aldo/keto reductase